jgi:hypothetical protein
VLKPSIDALEKQRWNYDSAGRSARPGLVGIISETTTVHVVNGRFGGLRPRLSGGTSQRLRSFAEQFSPTENQGSKSDSTDWIADRLLADARVTLIASCG